MISVSEMVNRSRKSGSKWFDRDTMIFWGTVIEANPNKDNIFITSEWDSIDKENRRYTLRHFNVYTNQVETVGDFLQYETLKEAREGRRKVGDKYV